jgi:hypothetical protein
MSRFRILAGFALVLVLSASAGAEPRRSAEPPREMAASAEAETLVSRLWQWLAAIWTKEGCGIDPGGRCGVSPSTPAPPNQEAGCVIDPGGSPCGN